MSLNPEYEKIGSDIIKCAYEVRNSSHKGLREEYYKLALAWELEQLGYDITVEETIPVMYKGIVLCNDFRADIVVNNKVIIETKALGVMYEKECRQLLTYLDLTGMKLGYLINFGAEEFVFGRISDYLPYKKGLYRIVNSI